jgi:hypothetical protein
MAGALGVTLRMSKTCTQPCTDMQTKTVYVPYLEPYATDVEAALWFGFASHEVFHHAKEVQDIGPLMENLQIPWNCPLGQCINIVEDYRNDNNRYTMWPVRDDKLSKTHAFLCHRGVKMIRENGSDPETEWLNRALSFSYNTRVSWQPDLAVPAMEFNDLMQGSKYSTHADELRNAKTAKQVVALALKLTEKGTGKSESQIMQESQQTYQEVKGQGDGQGQGKGEGKGKGKGKPAKLSDKKGSGKGGTVRYEDIMGHVHDDEQGQGGGLVITYSDTESNDFQPDPRGPVITDISENEIPKIIRDGMQHHYDHSEGVSSKVRRLFRSRSNDKIVHRMKRGRLDKRSLHRIKQGDVDVFTQKESQVSLKNIDIHILTDCSGSMDGDRLETASAAAALLNDVITPLKIPLKITGFTDTTKGSKHFIIKEYTEKTSSGTIMDRFAQSSRHTARNSDGESIMWAYRDMMKRPAERKILLVLSDGMPNSSRTGDAATYLKSVVDTVGRDIEIYGIGILEDSVKNFYKEFTVLEDITQLETCLIEVIKQKIL